MPTATEQDAPALGVPMPGPFVGLWPALKRGTTLLWPLLALFAILAYNGWASPGFFKIEYKDVDGGRYFGSVIDILKNAAPTLILAMGMTLVIGTGGIDLSVGSVMAICGMIAATLISRPDTAVLENVNVHGSLILILLISMGVALLCGLWNGALVSYIGVQPIIATLILMVSGRGLAQVLNSGQAASAEVSIYAANNAVPVPGFLYLGKGELFGLPVQLFWALGVVLLTIALTRGTALGLFIESVGNSPKASRLAGVNEKVIKLVAYGFAGLCAGFAGLIEVANIADSNANNVGRNRELDAILAVAIGGTALTGGRFSLLGAVLGALIVQALETTINGSTLHPSMTQVIKGAAVIGVCLLQAPKFRRAVFGPLGRLKKERTA